MIVCVVEPGGCKDLPCEVRVILDCYLSRYWSDQIIANADRCADLSLFKWFLCCGCRTCIDVVIVYLIGVTLI